MSARRLARSAAALAGLAGHALVGSQAFERRRLDRLYSGAEDAWGYHRSPDDLARWDAVLETIAALPPPARAGALEVGCGEGFFTERVAPLCGNVLAVDISPIAVDRTRDRCDELGNVRAQVWDAARDPAVGRFPLVVCMDVVAEIPRPSSKRRALQQIVASVEPGGRLVMTELIQHPIVEGAWWASLLGAGGAWTLQHVEQRAPFQVVERRIVGRHLLGVFAAP